MDEFQQSDLEKETDDSHNTSYQNTIHYKEKENAFINSCGMLSLVFVVKLGDVCLRPFQ